MINLRPCHRWEPVEPCSAHARPRGTTAPGEQTRIPLVPSPVGITIPRCPRSIPCQAPEQGHIQLGHPPCLPANAEGHGRGSVPILTPVPAPMGSHGSGGTHSPRHPAGTAAQLRLSDTDAQRISPSPAPAAAPGASGLRALINSLGQTSARHHPAQAGKQRAAAGMVLIRI